MDNHLMLKALTAGYERIVAWADILDRINVYPVPDGDTGRNLVLTLSALKNGHRSIILLADQISLSARGNSGNIAARFLSGFMHGEGLEGLPLSAEAGRDLAYRAVSNPQPGTMLSLYDALVTSLKGTLPTLRAGGLHWSSTIWKMRCRPPRSSYPNLKKQEWSTPGPWVCWSSSILCFTLWPAVPPTLLFHRRLEGRPDPLRRLARTALPGLLPGCRPPG